MAKPPSPDSAVGKLRTFLRERPADWGEKTAAERRTLAQEATGMTAGYLNTLIHKSESYKDLFGVERRKKKGRTRRKKKVTVQKAAKTTRPVMRANGASRVNQILSLTQGLELSELVAVAKAIRKEIRTQFEAVQKEIDELKNL